MNIWLVPTILFFLAFIFIIIRKFKRAWAKALALVLTFLLFTLSLFRFIIPLRPSPDPVGGQKIQTGRVYYSHKTAYPDMATQGDIREVPVSIWAPQDLEEGGHPVLVFSHGSFGVSLSNETLFKELASRGYIVLSLDHPHHSFFSDLSDGTTTYVDRDFVADIMGAQGTDDLEAALASLKSWLEIRLEDISLVLDEIGDGDKRTEIEGAMDLDRLVLSGHSLGGSAMLALGREYEDRVRALVILEAPFVKDIEGVEGDRYVFTDQAYPLPLLHIYSDALYGKMDQITTYGMNQRLIEDPDPKYVNYHLQGVGHLGLTDMGLISPLLTNLFDGGLNERRPPETLYELNEVVIDFLEVYKP